MSWEERHPLLFIAVAAVITMVIGIALYTLSGY